MSIEFEKRIEWWVSENPLRRVLCETRSEGKGIDGLHGVVRECADELNVSRQTVSSWLHGVYLPSVRHFQRLFEKYGIGTDEWVKWWNARPKRRSAKKGSKAL